jgi:hypothetical protein
MDAISFGKAGLKGWRATVADAVAQPVSRHTPVAADQVRAAVGALFFALSVLYVAGTVRRVAAAREAGRQ